MLHRRKTTLLLALTVSLSTALASIILQEEVRTRLGESYYVVSLSIIGCILLILSGYIWDRSIWSRLKELGTTAQAIKSDTHATPEPSSVAPSGTEQDEIISIARQIERMARSVRRVDESYRGIVEDQLDLICRYKPDQTLTFVNGAYCRFFKGTRDELIGKRFHGLTTASSMVPLSTDATVKTFEQQVSTANNSTTWIQWSVREFHDEQTSLIEYQAVGHNITARKEAETALVIAKEAAEAANRAKGDFLAVVSHEIRNPISVVLGFTNILRDTELTPLQREHVNIIQRSGDSLLVLINDLLDFTKIEAGKIELETEPYSPHGCIEEVCAFYSPKTSIANLSISFTVAPEVPPLVVGDAFRLRQILTNLVGNAVKFTRQGGVTIELSISPNDTPSDKLRLQFTVSDTGIGISQEKISQLFQPYVQAEVSTSRKYGGTGLGLIICKRLSERMGGQIRAESTMGAGSKFIFDILVDQQHVSPALSTTTLYFPPTAEGS